MSIFQPQRKKKKYFYFMFIACSALLNFLERVSIFKATRDQELEGLHHHFADNALMCVMVG